MLASRSLRLPESITASYLISIITALCSGSIVLLNGNVGVGKTSIISKSAELLGGKAKIIPIRPSWLDPSDLLGFFDPLAETFRPSSFTSALKQANDYSDRPFLICLDELNLSRIENYGSDLLSTLEYSKNQLGKEGGHRKLSLYSEEIETELLHKIHFLDNIENPNVEQQLLIKKIQKLGNTPANLEIPENLVLIGTLNSDETTYDLSPKVIDRSYVITYPPADLELPSWLDDTAGIQEDRLSVSMLQTKIKNCINQIEGMVIRGGFDSQSNLLETLAFNWSKDWQQIIDWNKQYISELGIPVGHRIKREYQIFFSVSHCLGINSNDSKHCLAYFTFVKLLPRLSFFKNGERENICRKWIDDIKENYSMGGEIYILNQIQDQILDEGRRNVRYWG
jgi:RNA-directed DNA polymerase